VIIRLTKYNITQSRTNSVRNTGLITEFAQKNIKIAKSNWRKKDECHRIQPYNHAFKIKKNRKKEKKTILH